MLTLIILAGLGVARPAAAGHVLRGVDDPRLFRERADPADLHEVGVTLRADVIRCDIAWSLAEPRRGSYDDEYLDEVAATIVAARELDVQVVVLVYRTPEWASDRSLWSRPVKGDRVGVYHSYYPPAKKNLTDFQAFAGHLATRLKGTVLAYEPWCEPNMFRYLFPQRTARYADFAARRYRHMLRAFAAGVRAADPTALVCAGATAPFGRDDRYGTSPQRFARQLRTLGAASLFDVYTHHPYVPGGTRNVAPEAQPRDPGRTVSLGNLPTLLRIFPRKPFYMTEFGWSTHPSSTFGVWVSTVQQATYLRRAFAYLERFPQVKLGIWFPLKDTSHTGGYGDRWGVYSGLRRLDGTRKRAYYAFAGGNTLLLEAPQTVASRAAFTLRGSLASVTMGPLGGKVLDVETRRTGGDWRPVRQVTTRPDGTYAVNVRASVSSDWRVRWRGVTGSRINRVAVR